MGDRGKSVTASVVGNGATADGCKFEHITVIGEQHITQVSNGTGTPITPLADTHKSSFNASGAVVNGDVRMVDMSQAPVAMNASYAQASAITMVHGTATPEQYQAAAGLFPPPRK